MKKILLLLVLCSSTLMAQQFKKELIGKYVPAKVKWVTGTVEEVYMRYQPPQFFRNPRNTFYISSTQSEADAVKHTGDIEAFMIDNVIWALRPSPVAEPANSPNYVVLKKQGAIEEYQFMTSTLKSESDFKEMFNPSGTITKKMGAKGKMDSEMTDTQLREWISDSPEIMIELKQADSLAVVAKNQAEAKAENKETPTGSENVAKEKEAKPKGLLGKLESMQKKEAAMKAAPVTLTATATDMALIVNNYNVWYDKKYPEKIKYHFVEPPVRQKSPLEDFYARQARQEAFVKGEKEKEDAKKQKDEQFAKRTTTPSPENASAKDNLPEKKETFAAKIQRIKNDGNKMGVILVLNPVRVPKSTSTVNVSFSEPIALEGEYVDESLKAAVPEFVKELNQAFGTTDIELIDINNVPYRESKFGRLDDWWASKYKVVFAYTIDPQLKTSNEDIGGKIKFTATLNMITSLIVREFVGGPGATKQDILAQVLNMGSFMTPTFAQDDQITDVKIIYEKTQEKLGMPILEKMKIERADAVKKLIEKKLN